MKKFKDKLVIEERVSHEDYVVLAEIFFTIDDSGNVIPEVHRDDTNKNENLGFGAFENMAVDDIIYFIDHVDYRREIQYRGDSDDIEKLVFGIIIEEWNRSISRRYLSADFKFSLGIEEDETNIKSEEDEVTVDLNMINEKLDTILQILNKGDN